MLPTSQLGRRCITSRMHCEELLHTQKSRTTRKHASFGSAFMSVYLASIVQTDCSALTKFHQQYYWPLGVAKISLVRLAIVRRNTVNSFWAARCPNGQLFVRFFMRLCVELLMAEKKSKPAFFLLSFCMTTFEQPARGHRNNRKIILFDNQVLRPEPNSLRSP